LEILRLCTRSILVYGIAVGIKIEGITWRLDTIHGNGQIFPDIKSGIAENLRGIGLWRNNQLCAWQGSDRLVLEILRLTRKSERKTIQTNK